MYSNHVRIEIRRVRYVSAMHNDIAKVQSINISRNNSASSESRKLTARYRSACSEDLALALTFLRHPVAGRTRNVSALDHSFSLPDGYVATIRSRRVRVPLPLAWELMKLNPDLREFKDSQLFLFGVAVRISPPQPMIVSKDELAGNDALESQATEYDYLRSRAVAEALHLSAKAQWIHDNGSDCAFGGFRFGWIGTHDAQPLPSPKELFIPQREAA